jgi:hypothetical protein
MDFNCKNFDFGKNWNLIVPYLHTPQMEKLKKKAFHEIKINLDHTGVMYNKKEAIASSFTNNDGYSTMTQTMLETFIGKEDSRIPEALIDKYYTAWDKIIENEDGDDFEYEKKLWDKYMRIVNKIGDLVNCNYQTSPNHMVHFVTFSACHWFNRHCGMYWVKSLFPNVEWKLIKSKSHTTIISADGKYMFDLLSYAWNYDRFKAYCCEEEYEENDKSLGADDVRKILDRDKKNEKDDNFIF